jgi:hypothetical protein
MKPFEIKFKYISEIRNGSPYNLVELTHNADREVDLKANDDWQDRQSWTRNGDFVALVKWNFINGEPGFLIILLDTNKGEITKSNRIQGCCHKIRLKNDLCLSYQTFTLVSEKNEEKKYGLKNGIIKLK